MAAISLAIRLYEHDHGSWPEALDELVPEYLPAEPFDPFDAEMRPFQYRPHGEPPILYSVGPNGVDDGGTPPRSRSRDDGDIMFYLDGLPGGAAP